MTLAVRPYTPNDRASCQNVLYRAVHEGAVDFYTKAQQDAWAPSKTPDLSYADKLLDRWCWVAEAKDGVIGFMTLTENGYLDMAFVMPEAMGKGVADALYTALIEHAKAESLGTLTLNAGPLARRFFAKQGWQVKYAENHPSNGQVFERFHMSLTITEIIP